MRETFSRPDSSRSRRAGRRTPEPTEEPGQLTDREREVLRLLAAGMGTAGIARDLSISTATVRNHAQRIIAKLRVHSRLAAVARGYATGLIPVPESPLETPRGTGV